MKRMDPFARNERKLARKAGYQGARAFAMAQKDEVEVFEGKRRISGACRLCSPKAVCAICPVAAKALRAMMK